MAAVEDCDFEKVGKLDTDISHLSLYIVTVITALVFLFTSLATNLSDQVNPNKSTARNRNSNYILTFLRISSVSAIGIVSAVYIYTTLQFHVLAILFGYLVMLTVLLSADKICSLVATKYAAQMFKVTILSVITGYKNPASADNNAVDDGTLQELEDRVIAAAEDISVDDRDREMLKSILRLDFSNVRDIMVPSPDVVSVGADTTLEDLAMLMSNHGHSRIPVFENTKDTILGIIHAKDILPLLAKGEKTDGIRHIMRPAVFVPETKKLHELLEELQQNSVQMAIVIDEYGGTEGIVTMEDMLEEIVGEIEDEFSSKKQPVVHLPDGSALVDAGISIDDIEEELGVVLETTPEVDTLGGYVHLKLGRLPYVGDVVHANEHTIEVMSILGHRLRRLKINSNVGVVTTQD